MLIREENSGFGERPSFVGNSLFATFSLLGFGYKLATECGLRTTILIVIYQ